MGLANMDTDSSITPASSISCMLALHTSFSIGLIAGDLLKTAAPFQSSLKRMDAIGRPLSAKYWESGSCSRRRSAYSSIRCVASFSRMVSVQKPTPRVAPSEASCLAVFTIACRRVRRSATSAASSPKPTSPARMVWPSTSSPFSTRAAMRACASATSATARRGCSSLDFSSCLAG